MRTSNIQIPTYKEIENILAFESKRDLDEEKNTTYGKFKPILDLLRYFKLPTTFFEITKFENMENVDTYNNIVKTFNGLSNNTLDTIVKWR